MQSNNLSELRSLKRILNAIARDRLSKIEKNRNNEDYAAFLRIIKLTDDEDIQARFKNRIERSRKLRAGKK